MEKERINILMVDDQPAKLMSYEAILGELDENLIKATRRRPHGRQHARDGRLPDG
jgi:hypothetical protein